MLLQREVAYPGRYGRRVVAPGLCVSTPTIFLRGYPIHQTELNRAVARATGETMATVKRLGFLLAESDDAVEAQVQIVDWDQLAEEQDVRAHERADCENVSC